MTDSDHRCPLPYWHQPGDTHQCPTCRRCYHVTTFHDPATQTTWQGWDRMPELEETT